MILKINLVIKEQSQDSTYEAEIIVDDEEQAHAAGSQFWRLSSAFAAGMSEEMERDK